MDTGSGDSIFALVEGTGFRTLVFLHGQLGTCRVLVPMAQPFVKDFKCLLPDIRGRGNSVSRNPGDHSWEQYVDDVMALLRKTETEKAVLIGVSMGAGLAISAALRYPDRALSLALISSPYAGGESGWTPRQLAIQEKVLKTAELVLQNRLEEAFPSGEVPKKWARHDLISIATAIVGLGLSQPFESAEQLRSIDVPVFISQGNDDLHPPEIGTMYEHYFSQVRRPGEGTLNRDLKEFVRET